MLNLRIFVPAESKLSNSGKDRDNYDFWGLYNDPLVACPSDGCAQNRLERMLVRDFGLTGFRPGESIRLRTLAHSSDRRSQK